MSILNVPNANVCYNLSFSFEIGYNACVVSWGPGKLGILGVLETQSIREFKSGSFVIINPSSCHSKPV